jgi:isochorismate hydrolase
VREAFERSFHVFLVRDATACYEPGLHEAALKALGLNCALLTVTDAVLSAWNL